MWNFCGTRRMRSRNGATLRGDVEKLRQLILAEEFLNCVPEEISVHLCERKNDLCYEMAALADEYTLTHQKNKEKIYTWSQRSRMKIKAELSPEEKPTEENRRTFQRDSRMVVCYKCGKAGHIAIRCQLGKGPETNRTKSEKLQGAVTTAKVNQSYRPRDEERGHKRPKWRTRRSINFMRHRGISVITSTRESTLRGHRSSTWDCADRGYWREEDENTAI